MEDLAAGISVDRIDNDILMLRNVKGYWQRYRTVGVSDALDQGQSVGPWRLEKQRTAEDIPSDRIEWRNS